MTISPATLALVAWEVLACSTTKPIHSLPTKGSYCEPSLTYAYNEKYAPLSPIPADTSLARLFSKHDLLMANAIGILPLLQTIAKLKTNNAVGGPPGKSISVKG